MNPLKYAAVARMPSSTTTVSTVSSTRFLFDALGLFGAVMGLLWRPGRGTTGGTEVIALQWFTAAGDQSPALSSPACLGFNGLLLSSGS